MDEIKVVIGRLIQRYLFNIKACMLFSPKNYLKQMLAYNIIYSVDYKSDITVFLFVIHILPLYLAPW